ncbi:mRNA export factor GLE1-like isoform X1 [Prorops nasuta]|uniref:mRNA export factor GLE1-like isoform X1 n=1 Tax=Prorops nasuta TaxID=863751 RepID=UPI0034CDB2E7
MPHFSIDEKQYPIVDVNDVTSDFTSVKISAMRKASRISAEFTKHVNNSDSFAKNKSSENVENEKNSCNSNKSKDTFVSLKVGASPDSSITFSLPKIILEAKIQREENVRRIIEKRKLEMEKKDQEIRENMVVRQLNMAHEREKKTAEQLEKIQKLLQIAEQEEIREQHEQKLKAQEAKEQEMKLLQEEELKKSIVEKNEWIGQLVILDRKFKEQCAEFDLLIKSCNPASSAVLNLAYQELCSQMERIIEKEIENIELLDFHTAMSIVQECDEILNLLKSELAMGITDWQNASHIESLEAKNEFGNSPQTEVSNFHISEDNQVYPHVVHEELVNTESVAEDEKNEEPLEITEKTEVDSAKYTENSALQVPVENNELPTNDEEDYISDWGDKESLQLYANSLQFLDSYTSSYMTFSTSPETKKIRFEFQKLINIPVNAISGINALHLKDKYNRLNYLLNQKAKSIQHYPEAVMFCKAEVAKKLVSQGETLISSKPDMAFPIAAVSIALWNDHEDFGKLLLSYFHKTCPFTVPVFISQLSNQSTEDFYKALGYKYAEDGTIENQDKYLRRMSGVMRLYGSLTVTKQRANETKPHPFGLQNAWRWFAATLNCKPTSNNADLCATLIFDMLEVTGNALWNAYPKQFPKLLTLLINQYYSLMLNNSAIGSGPLVRLKEFLTQFLNKKCIPSPKGQLPPNFW